MLIMLTIQLLLVEQDYDIHITFFTILIKHPVF